MALTIPDLLALSVDDGVVALKCALPAAFDDDTMSRLLDAGSMSLRVLAAGGRPVLLDLSKGTSVLGPLATESMGRIMSFLQSIGCPLAVVVGDDATLRLQLTRVVGERANKATVHLNPVEAKHALRAARGPDDKDPWTVSTGLRTGGSDRGTVEGGSRDPWKVPTAAGFPAVKPKR